MRHDYSYSVVIVLHQQLPRKSTLVQAVTAQRTLDADDFMSVKEDDVDQEESGTLLQLAPKCITHRYTYIHSLVRIYTIS